MENIIIVIALLLIAGGIITYLLRAKRSGRKCIGCPYSGKCPSSYSCQTRSDCEE